MFKETRGATFELLRHFLARLLEGDIVTVPGQMTAVWIGAVPVVLQWFLLMIAPLRFKYGMIASRHDANLYRSAVRADQLWLITLVMAIIGLLTAMKWQFLFPDLRDYRALGMLPLRARQMFGAKLAALLLAATAAMIVVNALPSVGFPAIAHTPAPPLAIASSAGCAFFFFGLVGLQGLLLNLLPPRAFGNLTGYLQGFFVALMLGLAVLSFSIDAKVFQLPWLQYLPPAWFMGLAQALAGDTNPLMRTLANRAEASLAIALVLALGTYGASYQRHRALLVEGVARRAGEWRAGRLFVEALSKYPRQQAVLAFMVETLARSNRHRTIAMGYAGLAFALVVTGVEGMDRVFPGGRLNAARFVYYHVIAVIFLVLGARHLFSLPSELKANWAFQIAEGEGRIDWLRAVDRFVLLCGFVLVIALPLPVELRLLGWRALAEAALFCVLGVLVYEWAFFDWNKLPFTCSYLPGKTPTWMILALFGLLGLVAFIHTVLVAMIYSALAYVIVLPLLLAAWVKVRAMRRAQWSYLRIRYEEHPEPAVHSLTLLH